MDPARIWTPTTLADLEPRPVQAIRTPFPMDPTPEIEETLALLARVVDRYAGDPENAWAVSHGIQARGPRFKMLDGRNAIQGLFDTYAETWEAAGRLFPRFPLFKGEVKVEPHTDQILKILTDVGTLPTTQVRAQGRRFTVADLWRGTVARSYLDPAASRASYGSNDDIAWSLQAIAAWAPPRFAWTAVDGTSMTLDGFTSYARLVLDTETRFLAESLATGVPFERAGQGVFHYICGGAHLLQGTAYAVARGYGRAEDREAVRAQVPLWFHRLEGELALYDKALDSAPHHRTRLSVQRMAFTGHFLESMHKLAAYGLFQPTPTQARQLVHAAGQITRSIRTLREAGVLDHMPRLKARDMQLYLDVVGDSAHALFSLELALGRQPVHL